MPDDHLSYPGIGNIFQGDGHPAMRFVFGIIDIVG